MSEAWTQWQGQMINGTLPLRKYLGGSARGGVFQTEYRAGNLAHATVRLVPLIEAAAEAQLAQWRTVAALSHPHLARVFDSGRCQLGDRPFLYVVMEYADQTLAQILQIRPMTVDEVRELLTPVLDALSFLHRQSLVHGRLAPANILAVGDQLKLSSDSIRSAGVVSGLVTPGSIYDAPETRAGIAGTSSDLWSLGVTIVEALTRQLPAWPVPSFAVIEIPSTLPPEFAGTVRRCLNRSPSERPTAAELQGGTASPAAAAPAIAVPPAAAPPQVAPPPAAPTPPAPPPVAAGSVAPPPAAPPSIAPSPIAAPPVAALPQVALPPAAPPRTSPPPVSTPPVTPSAPPPRVASPPVPPPPPAGPPPAAPSPVAPSSAAPPPAKSRAADISPAPPAKASVADQAAPTASDEQPAPNEWRGLGKIAAIFIAIIVVWAVYSRLHRSTAPATIPPEQSSSAPAPAAPPVAQSPPRATAAPAPNTASSTPSIVHQQLPNASASALATVRGHFRVTVRVEVDPAGKVIGASLQDPGPSRYFAGKAIEAARQWRFAAIHERANRTWLLRFEFTRAGATVSASGPRS
jgi:TonB family protein